ncbi:uncharacterized protein LOC110731985 isoform X2 [Chenopodium quinoa]|uniref:uncharacterized protein LOC110731985 isoform X2 n=1 Tax=Chenopodium quinoa TaxID=63459 RepID=UPI000B784C6F|nr:uncharacterized protein LOC110731985 isoform X2 [Chenopodium quinoa]
MQAFLKDSEVQCVEGDSSWSCCWWKEGFCRNLRNHWVLLVLCMAKREVIIFDSLRQKRNLEIKFAMTNAFRSFKALSGQTKGSKLTWHLGQLGGRECGYYVMRYMYEILEHHQSSEDLIQDFSRTTPYTEEEINEIRDIWAEYFICNVEL